MKKIASLTVLILIASICFGQTTMPNFNINESTNKISYSEVVILDSITSKEILYSKAREWFAKSYNSSNNVIQMDSKESGKIIGKALFDVTFSGPFKKVFNGGVIHYTIAIYLRDGRYKYEITDFYHTGGLANGHKTPDGGSCENLITREKGFWGNSYKKTYLQYLIQMDEYIKALIYSLKDSMKESAKDSKKIENDDW